MNSKIEGNAVADICFDAQFCHGGAFHCNFIFLLRIRALCKFYIGKRRARIVIYSRGVMHAAFGNRLAQYGGKSILVHRFFACCIRKHLLRGIKIDAVLLSICILLHLAGGFHHAGNHKQHGGGKHHGKNDAEDQRSILLFPFFQIAEGKGIYR